MDFLTLDPDSFDYGAAVEVAPLVRRVVAENPSKFTYLGTGTYIVGRGDVAVIDPGPALDDGTTRSLFTEIGRAVQQECRNRGRI